MLFCTQGENEEALTRAFLFAVISSTADKNNNLITEPALPVLCAEYHALCVAANAQRVLWNTRSDYKIVMQHGQHYPVDIQRSSRQKDAKSLSKGHNCTKHMPPVLHEKDNCFFGRRFQCFSAVVS